MKALVFTEIPEYCDWTNVVSVYLVPDDFNEEAERRLFESSYPDYDWDRFSYRFQEWKKKRKADYHAHIASRFQSIEHDACDY